MLLERHNWIKGYQQILNDCRPSLDSSLYGSCGTVLILCNPDADALCAARILSYAFRADNIPYQLRPCTGMRKLISILESLNLFSPTSQSLHDHESINGERPLEQEEGVNYDFYNEWNDIHQNSGNTGTNSAIRSIVLLNFGATKNLNTTLYSPRSTGHDNAKKGDTFVEDEDEKEEENDDESFHVKPPLVPSQIKTFVLDSHRPYHLANIYAGKNIVLLNDYNHWHDDVGGIPGDGDGLSGDEEEESDEDEESDEGESDQDTEDEEDRDEGEAEFEDEDEESHHECTLEDEKKNSLKRSPEDDGDNEDGDLSTVRGGKRRRQDDIDTPDTEASTDNEDGEDDHSDASMAMNENSDDRSNTYNTQSVREQHQIRRDHIQKYYEGGSFHSSPVSIMAYDLSRKIRHDSVGDLLWLACVGVTDAYIHSRLDLSGYIKLSIELQEHVKNMYPDDSDDVFLGMNQRLNNTLYAEELYSGNSNNNDVSHRHNGAMTQVGFSENGRIVIQKDEFQFFLLRHLSLWDAMYLSPLVNTKMLLWKQSGVQKLKEMLAKMGLPLGQCRQPYAFMKPALKRRLKLTIMEHADEYGLDNLSYTGFLRITGYKSLLSASDVAFAVTALLECETKYNHDQIAGESKNSRNTDPSLTCTEQEHDRILMNSFNTAYDALNSNASSSLGLGTIACGGLGPSIMGEGTDLSSLVNGGDSNCSAAGIGAGLRLAALLQSAIVSTATGLVERKAIYRLTQFRYAYINATSQGANGGTTFKSGSTSLNKRAEQQQHNHHIFSKPLALTKLAIFLMDMHRKNNKWTGTKARPLILLAENPQTQTYLVVGYEFPEERGSTKKNKFEQKFKLATDTMQGTFHYDSFEANVVEVKSSDVKNFLEHLHYMTDSL